MRRKAAQSLSYVPKTEKVLHNFQSKYMQRPLIRYVKRQADAPETIIRCFRHFPEVRSYSSPPLKSSKACSAIGSSV